jgi:hypothetical protein
VNVPDNDVPLAEDDGWETSSSIEEGVDPERIADLMRSTL